MDDFKKETLKEVGIGGMKCPCCGPKPGNERRVMRRHARRRLKAEDLKNNLDSATE